MRMRRTKRLSILVLLLGGLGLVVQSTVVRMDREADDTASVESLSGGIDARSVTLLVDVDDDVSDSTLERIEEEVREAVLPFDSSADALGDELNDNANLFRLTIPTSELRDVEAALLDEDLEAFEIEATFTVPDSEYAVALSDTEPMDGAEPFIPNDPYYKHQWHLDQIQMPQAWRRSQGEGAIVAVIDTGVLFRDHGRHRQAPDLAGTNFVPGYDFVDGDDTPDDGHGHGTHVAGTIAQSTNNGLGVAGVAPAARIMPIRVLDDRGAGKYGNVAAGIRWAVDNGANILNLSLGGPTPSPAISSAIRYAHSKDVLVVVAAGNTGRSRVQFPGSAAHAFSVGAVRFDEELSFYSSHGRKLDIVAPGGDLRVDQNGDGLPDGVVQNTMLPRRPGQHDYLGYQGTSMAAPHVAGVAALLYASGVTDPDAIERILESTAKAKSNRNRYGAGLIQANDALVAASQKEGAKGLLAAFLAFAVFGFSRRRRLGLALGAGLLAGSGFLGFSAFGFLATSLGAFWPIALSAALPLGLAALGHHKKLGRLSVALVGAGLAGWLLVEAAWPSLASGVLVGPWLVLSAALSMWVARITLRDAK